MGWFPALLNPLSGASEIRNAGTLYTAPLLLGPASMCASHPGPITASAPLVCLVEVTTQL